MSFKLVLLDYAKHQLDNPAAQKALNDLIIVKQKNFERTDPNYVVVDKHDMIGTHALIYDTSNIFQPKLIFALRLTFAERCRVHKIKTPMQDLAPLLDPRCRQAYEEFVGPRPDLVDCNSWFVDENYSFKNSGLRLSDIGYVMMYLQISRMGHDHFIGCTNEKYKAHRWIESVGYFKKGFEFIHPVVPDPHMIIMMEKFNVENMRQVYNSHRSLFDNMMEISPPGMPYASLAETLHQLLQTKVAREDWPEKKAG